MPWGKSLVTRSRRRMLSGELATFPPTKEGTRTTNSTSAGDSDNDNDGSNNSSSTSSNAVNGSIDVSGENKICSGHRNSHPMSVNREGIKNLVVETVVTRMKHVVQKIREELRDVLSAELREVVSAEMKMMFDEHKMDVRVQVQNMLDEGGGKGNQLTNNSNGNHEKVVLKDLQKKIGERVKKYVRDTLYSELKFCEHDHIDAIYRNLMQRKDMTKPDGINNAEYEKVVKTTIKQGFSSLRHNSQSLMRKNFCGK